MGSSRIAATTWGVFLMAISISTFVIASIQWAYGRQRNALEKGGIADSPKVAILIPASRPSIASTKAVSQPTSQPEAGTGIEQLVQFYNWYIIQLKQCEQNLGRIIELIKSRGENGQGGIEKDEAMVKELERLTAENKKIAAEIKRRAEKAKRAFEADMEQVNEDFKKEVNMIEELMKNSSNP